MKKRLDVLLTELNMFDSRERAKAAIMAGLVTVDGRLSDKAGTPVDEKAIISVKGSVCPYVSRGGFKLEKALAEFSVSVAGLRCVDIGASTGGFTDCLLQNGASYVYSVDVGYGQLDWKLRSDSRVCCMEKVNFRYLDPESIPEKLDLAVADVSFISLKLMFPVAEKLLKPDGRVICLVKPQFEAGREQVGKHGIVKDPTVHESVISKVCGYANDNGFTVINLCYSPVKGAKGNIEYLLYLQKGLDAEDGIDVEAQAMAVVQDAHMALDANDSNKEE